jgi:hypothetical protein
MLLPESLTISIRTENQYYTAIFERVYKMNVHASDDEKAVITIKAHSNTPSGFPDSDSRCTLVESEEIKKPTKGTAKAWLAKLANEKDALINEFSRGLEFDKSARIVRSKLQKMF